MRMPGRPLSIRTRLTLWYTGVLLAILIVVSALSLSILRWSLVQDLDTSLLAVATVIRDAGPTTAAGTDAAETMLRGLLGSEFYDKFFQVIDPDGRAAARSSYLGRTPLPLSPEARANALRGRRTFETTRLAAGERIRLLTLPVVRDGTLAQIVQVGMGFERAEQALARYVETLLILVPLGLVLAASGGAIIARALLARVDAMSQTARRITAEDLSRRLALRGTGDELDRLAATLNEMLARLEAAFTEVRRFAADAAHELRTPLTALRGGIEVALRSTRPPEEYRRVLESSLEEVERLTRLAEDLLLLSRFSVTVSAPREPVPLEPLVLDALDVATQLAHARGVAVGAGELHPAVVIGDAVALRRAVLNLVDNAVKYTPAGGKVELALARRDGMAEIAVRDTGIGIDAVDAERVFQPFVRLPEAQSRDRQGAGLGLAIARSIALAHGGEVRLESARGQGTTVTLRLPLA